MENKKISKNALYHNPDCSKSRATLEIIRQKGINVEIIEYLKAPPSIEELEYICTKLQVEPTAIIRTTEKTFSDLSLNVNDSRNNKDWFSILNKNPILIERPILVYKGKAAIGRPPENVLKII